MRYNTPSSAMDNLRDYFTRGGIPVTIALLAVSFLTFLVTFFSPAVRGIISRYMLFSSSNVLHAPWTIFTYPLVAGGFSLWLIIIWAFFWMTGGSLERSWGSVRFAVFFFAVTAVTALSVLLGGIIIRTPIGLPGDIFLPLMALVVAFCMINAEQTMQFFFFPIKAKYIALIAVLWTYFEYGSLLGPLLGLFALGGILAAYLYVRFGRAWADIDSYARRPSRGSRGPDLRVYPAAKQFTTQKTTLDGSTRRSPFDLYGRWKDYQVRKGLEKLWKNSGFSEPDARRRNDDRRP